MNMMLFCCLPQMIHMLLMKRLTNDDVGFGGNLDLPADVPRAVETHGAESSESETDDEIDKEPKEQR